MLTYSLKCIVLIMNLFVITKICGFHFTATNKLYACVVSREDHFVRKDGGKFDAEEFERFPSKYASVFSHKVKIKFKFE